MNKRKKAEALYDAIGSIDDIFVYEAMIYQKKKRAFTFKRFSLVLTALFVCMMTVFVIRTLSIRDTGTNAPSDNVNSSDSLTLDYILSKADGESFSSKEEIDLFDGNPKFVYFNGESYKTVNVNTDAEYVAKRLTLNALPDTEEISFRVWLCDGNGHVISPYVKLSYGNIGFNELFDYHPEGIPSTEFSEYVNRIV